MGKSYRIRTSVPELQKTLNSIAFYDGRTAQKVENVIGQRTKAIAKGARKRAPKMTGKLKKSIRASFKKKECAGYVKVYVPHAHLIEFGVKASISKPKKKKAMVVDEYGVRRIVKKANIPSRPAQPFMKPAYEEQKPNITRDIKMAVKKT